MQAVISIKQERGLINKLESLIMGLEPEFLSEQLIKAVFKS